MTSLKELIEYIESGIKRGHTIENLKKALLAQGVKIGKIEEAIEERTKVTKLNAWLARHPFLRYWDPVLIYAIVIILLSFMPAPPTPEKLLGLEHIITNTTKHFLLYFGFSFLLGIACKHSRYTWLRWNHYTAAIAIAILLGIFDEVNQLFVSGRFADIMDVAADAAGAVSAQVFLFAYHRFKKLAVKNNPQKKN